MRGRISVQGRMAGPKAGPACERPGGLFLFDVYRVGQIKQLNRRAVGVM
jgi:hypothetical protein